MEVRQLRVEGPHLEDGWQMLATLDPDLVLVFAPVRYFKDQAFIPSLRRVFPRSVLLGCSTAGEITRDGCLDGQAILTGVKFHHASLRAVSAPLHDMASSRETGFQLGRQLAPPEGSSSLRGILLLSQGVRVNGSAMLQGMRNALDCELPIFGALAGDDGAFQQTFTLCQDSVSDRDLVALGLYGEKLEIRAGSAGGWTPFGPVRKITRSKDNVLFELDGEPALDVYRRYLGEWAKDLPGSGLLFPIALLEDEQYLTGLVRTLLGVDDADGSLILAGDVPENGLVRLMHADTNSLVKGAQLAAEKALGAGGPASLALLFSCLGRKLVMGGRVDEEVEVVAELLGPDTILAGFHSYGEIGPHANVTDSRLHNQTMTVSLLNEHP